MSTDSDSILSLASTIKEDDMSISSETEVNSNFRTKSVSVKISELRKNGYNNIEDWINTKGNIYVGRKGRLFIHDGKGGKRYYTYPQSKFHRPTRIHAKNYVKYLYNSGLIHDLEELRGKNLGCFCIKHRDSEGNAICHAQMLADLVNGL